MKSGSIVSKILRFLSTLLLIQAGFVSAAELRMFSTIGVRAVMQELGPQFERATSHKLTVTYDVANALKRRIDAGESFDIAILTVPVMDELIKQGKIVRGSRAVIARGGMGLAVRSGAPKPDINSPDAFKRALLNAKSVAYPKEGLAGIHMASVLARLGIAEDMKGKVLLTGAESPAQIVARGEAEMAAHIIPELLAVTGVEFLGPLPADLQTYIVLPAGISTSAAEPGAAGELLKFLTGPSAVPIIKSKGYEPG